MEYFAGLDVSLRSCALCIVDSKGATLLERELRCEIKDIAEYLDASAMRLNRSALKRARCASACSLV